MIAAMLHGVFVVWRNGTDKETIYEYTINQTDEHGQLPKDAYILNYKPEIVCSARVPIFGAEDNARAIDKKQVDEAQKVLFDDLVHQIKNRSDLARIRAQLLRFGEKGKPRPPVEVVDEHDWSKLWENASGLNAVGF